MPEWLFAVGFVVFAAVAWSALLLAEFGAFSLTRVLWAASIVAGAAFVWAWGELRARFASRGAVSTLSWVSLALTLIAATFLYLRPSECLIEGRDGSVYVAIGRTIAQTGGIVSTDPLLNVVPAATVEPLLARDPLWPHLLNRFPGGIQMRNGDPHLSPNFFHLLPALAATGFAILGPRGTYGVNAVFGVLAVFALWLVGRRVWSPVAGVVAASLLAVSFGEVVYARLAVSEILAQFLLLAGLCFTLLAVDTRSRLAGACAGAAIGLAALSRIDELCVLLPLAAVWLAVARRRRALGPAWGWYAATLGVVGLHAVAHALLVSGPYTVRLCRAAWNGLPHPSGGVILGLIGGLIAAVSVCAVLGVAWHRRCAPRCPPDTGARIAATVGAAVALAIFGPAAVIAANRLLSVPGLVAAFGGLVLLLWRTDGLRTLPMVLPFVAEAVLLGTWRETVALSADFRRVVPVMLPLATLYTGVLVATGASHPRRALRIAAWTVAGGIGSLWIWQVWPVLRQPPLQNLHNQVAQLAGRIPPGAVVISDRSVPSHLPLALQSSFGRIALPLIERPGSTAALQSFVEHVRASGRPAYVMVASSGIVPQRLRRTDFVDFSLRQVDVVPLHYTQLVPVLREMPRALPTTSVFVELYELTPGSDGHGAALPVVINIGDTGFESMLGGFYAAESMPSARARWTGGEGTVALPRVGRGARPASLVLRLAAYRPPGLPPPTVRLRLDGAPVGTIMSPGPSFGVYRLRLDEATSTLLTERATTLTVASDTFVPHAAGLGADLRVLGVAIDWIPPGMIPARHERSDAAPRAGRAPTGTPAWSRRRGP